MHYIMQTALHDAHDTYDATGDTYDTVMLRCKLTIIPDGLSLELKDSAKIA